MRANLRVSWEGVHRDEHAQSNGSPAAKWTPTPKAGQASLLVKAQNTNGLPTADHGTDAGSGAIDNRVVPLIRTADAVVKQRHPISSCAGVRFGFADPTDCVTALVVPAEAFDAQARSSTSFEIEFDSEQPDHVSISLLDVDEDGFIRTVQTSMSFPARLLAELLSRRKATAEEAAEWQAPDEDGCC